MNVTVADCLKLPTLREAQLIAGDKGLERAVSSVSVLEWPETNLLSDDVLIGNELIISALVPIKDDVALQCAILRHLRCMGAAGLILFYVGVFIPQIDDALIAVADEICFPLIAMPFGRMDFRYSDVITDVVEYIHSRRMQGNYYTAELMNSIALLETLGVVTVFSSALDGVIIAFVAYWILYALLKNTKLAGSGDMTIEEACSIAQ